MSRTGQHRVSEPEDERGALHGFSEPRRRGVRGCLLPLAVLVVLAVLVAGALVWGVREVRQRLDNSPDYAGPGTGSVQFQVPSGATSAAIGTALQKADVVKSAQAFIDAARSDSRSRGIQVGYYLLKRHMKATEALAVLVNHKNLIQTMVTVPEGSRVDQVVAAIVAKTDITKKAVDAALAHPGQIGLPAAAKGNPEGYLFPATYAVTPGETAVQLVSQMVAKTASTLSALNVASRARAVGLSEEQVLTFASILEYEARRNQDYPKVARAIYNRLKIGMKIQSDATVSFANGKTGVIATTAAERNIDSPYNTYRFAGLPPGPIGSPGEETINATLHPAKGPWLYWVVVNLRTGETDVATTLAEHDRQVEKYVQYCKTSTAC